MLNIIQKICHLVFSFLESSIISLFFLKSIIEKIQKLDEKLSETSKEYFLFNVVTIWEQLEHDAKLSDVRINEIFKKVQGENDDSEL